MSHIQTRHQRERVYVQGHTSLLYFSIQRRAILLLVSSVLCYVAVHIIVYLTIPNYTANDTRVWG